LSKKRDDEEFVARTPEELAGALGLEPVATVAAWRARALQEKVEKQMSRKARAKVGPKMGQ